MLSSSAPMKKYFLVMFLISCLLLGVFTLVIYKQSRVNQASSDWVVESYEVLRIGRMALIDSIDLSGHEQDFILSGYKNHLDAYNASLQDLNTRLDVLRRATNGNLERYKDVVPFYNAIENMKKIGAAHIDAQRKHKVSAYTLQAGVRDSRRAITVVRDAFKDFSAGESRALDERMKAADEEQKNYLSTLFMGAVLGLGALVFANLVIYLLMARNTRNEDRLRKTEELFSIVLSGINDGIYDHNIAKGTISYSPSYKDMLGYSEKELGSAEETFHSLIHPDDMDGIREVLGQYINHEIPSYECTFRLRHKDGRWVWVLSRGVGIWGDDGKIQRLIGAHTDISLQKQREEELNYFIRENKMQEEELKLAKEKAESANQAKTEFLATTSHEIRTPMNAVVGLTHLLLQTPLNEKQTKMVETLQNNADILLGLVNDLLDISRIESGQMELEHRSFTVANVFNALNAMFQPLATGKNIVLKMVNNVGNQAYIGDPVRIQQIIMNLVGNALKFTGAQGSIIITSEYELQGSDTTKVRFVVTDTGIGIPPEKIDTIFEKFVQVDQTISRRFGGFGLGLAICQTLAHLMGGHIGVTSTPGKGSTFTFSIDLKMDKNPVAKKKPVVQVAAPAHGTILVVEDYAPNVMVATMILENLGYTVESAVNGKEAIDMLSRRSGEPYKAILMDVQMQDMDGLETTRRIRVMEKETGHYHPIIGVTAHALAGDRDRCLEAGMDDYMSKPVHPELLAQRLSQINEVVWIQTDGEKQLVDKAS